MIGFVYFTGVRPGDRSGHHCYGPGYVRSHRQSPLSPWGWSEGGYALLDWHPERDGVCAPRATPSWRDRKPEVEGHFAHLQHKGWTLIAAWDRSGDPRGGCTASFAFSAELTPAEALVEARQVFPEVFARIEEHLGREVTCA